MSLLLNINNNMNQNKSVEQKEAKNPKKQPMRPKLTYQDQSPYSGEAVQVRVFSKDENPYLSNKSKKNQAIIAHLKKRAYKDGLIADRSYEHGMWESKNHEQEKLRFLIEEANYRHSKGVYTLSEYTQKVQDFQQEYKENMLNHQILLESDFICQLLEEQLDIDKRRDSKE